MKLEKILKLLEKYRHYLSLGLTSFFFRTVNNFANFYLAKSYLLPEDIPYLIFILKWIFVGVLLIIVWSYILSFFDCIRGDSWLDSPYLRLASILAFFLGLISCVELILSPY